jgi:hypothetical protein
VMVNKTKNHPSSQIVEYKTTYDVVDPGPG